MIPEIIKANDETLAIIVRSDYQKEGVTFFTPDDFSQQLAYMKHPKNKVIDPHVHKKIERTVLFTNEVLVIIKGILKVDFYNSDQIYITSTELSKGDVILLVSGGHGFKVLEDVEMFEIKQGPYAGENDKVRFKGIINE